MKLAIMQPYFFPYLGYFQLLHAADKFVFYDDVNFIKNGWINRNRLLLDGNAHYFTVPLSGASALVPIKDIRFDASSSRWRRKMLGTFHLAYKNAPYRNQGLGMVESVLSTRTDSIALLARRSVLAVMEYLGIQREIVETSQVYANSHLKGPSRVLDICRREAAHIYGNLPGGRALYDEREFLARGIELRFIDVQLPAYPQGQSSFVPGLSILDVVMRCSPAETRHMLSLGELTPSVRPFRERAELARDVRLS
jgi:hypothetical protein